MWHHYLYYIKNLNSRLRLWQPLQAAEETPVHVLMWLELFVTTLLSLFYRTRFTFNPLGITRANIALASKLAEALKRLFVPNIYCSISWLRLHDVLSWYRNCSHLEPRRLPLSFITSWPPRTDDSNKVLQFVVLKYNSRLTFLCTGPIFKVPSGYCLQLSSSYIKV